MIKERIRICIVSIWGIVVIVCFLLLINVFEEIFKIVYVYIYVLFFVILLIIMYCKVFFVLGKRKCEFIEVGIIVMMKSK